MTNGYHRGLPRVQEYFPHRVALAIATHEALPIEALTPRETEVLVALADGLDNAGIARELGIARKTVGTHIHIILYKLHAANRTQAVTIAYRIGLLEIYRDGESMTAATALAIAQKYIDLAQKLMVQP